MKPCIRGLKEFKKGCPENSSCPAWIETLGRKQPVVIQKCVTIAMVDLLWDLNCNVIGTQVASEGTRNMMAYLSSVASGNREHVQELNRSSKKHLKESEKFLQNAEN